MQSNLTFEERKAIFAKPIWSNHDICLYFECGKSKAEEIRKMTIGIDGITSLLPKRTTRNAIFKALKIDLNKEMEIYRSLSGKEQI